MSVLTIIGIFLGVIGLVGLIFCIYKAIKVKKEHEAKKTLDENFKKEIGKLAVINMACLLSSILGAIILTIGLILPN